MRQPLVQPIDREPVESRSEIRLRAMLDSTGIGISELNQRSGRREWSTSFREILGLPVNQSDRPGLLRSLIHPRDVERVEQAFRRALQPQTGGQFDEIFRVQTPNGFRLVRMAGKVFFAADTPTHSISSLQDLTSLAHRLSRVELDEFDKDHGGIAGRALIAARGFLNWSVRELALAAEVSESTIRRLEDEAQAVGVSADIAADVRLALERAGIVFSRVDGRTAVHARPPDNLQPASIVSELER
jgi:PAS domain S-box-containing protein